MSEFEFDFDVLFSITRLSLLSNRAHPYIKRDLKWLLQFFVLQGIFTFIYVLILYNIVLIDLKNHDFVKACSNGVFGVVYNVVTFQYSVMLWYQKQFVKLIDLVKRDYETAKTLPAVQADVVMKYAMNGRFVTKLWVALAAVTGFLFPVKAAVSMIYLSTKGNFRLVPIYEARLPGAWDHQQHELVGFLLLYALMLFYAFFAMTVYIGFAPLGPIFMLHACGQLELVQMKVRVLFSDECYDPVTTKRKLSEIINHYNNITCFINLIKESLRVFYEVCLKTTALFIPITCFEVIQSFKNGIIGIEFICFIVAAFILCFAPCYYSDLLMDKGQEVGLAVYMSGWESHWDSGTRRTLLIFLSWAQTPLAIRTVFRIVCLDAFTELCHQSYAIFNVLNAAWS